MRLPPRSTLFPYTTLFRSTTRRHRGSQWKRPCGFPILRVLMDWEDSWSRGPPDAVVRSRKAPLLHHHNGRCDSATEQDQADVARRAVRHDGLALDLPRVYRGGYGASGLRYPVHRHAARHDRDERCLADAAGDLADRHGAGRAGAVE